ncbi:MAG: ROK family glucokinase [Marmoricola sp.]
MSLTVGIDIGGTKIAGGVVDESGHVVAETRRDSPADHVDAITEAVVDIVEEFRREHQIVAVGVAAAGFLDRERDTVMFAPNLAWRDAPLRSLVKKRVQLPTVLENDANAAAWAEYRFGAGRDARTLALVASGTGIGGGLVIDGRLFLGGFGVGAEFGHMRVVPNGRRCNCGLNGCWEAYGSGTGLTARARELVTENAAGAPVLVELSGGDIEAIDGRMVTEAAERGDPAAKQCFVELARWLGEGMASLSAVLDPDVFVVGGGVAESPELDLKLVIEAFGPAESGAGHRPTPAIRLAELGNSAGLIGAADLARVQA